MSERQYFHTEWNSQPERLIYLKKLRSAGLDSELALQLSIFCRQRDDDALRRVDVALERSNTVVVLGVQMILLSFVDPVLLVHLGLPKSPLESLAPCLALQVHLGHGVVQSRVLAKVLVEVK